MKTNYNTKINRISLSVFIILSLLISGRVFAFEKTKSDMPSLNDFVVEPGKTEIFANPGETVIKSISVTSRINKTVKFKLTTEDMIGTSDVNSPIQLLGGEKGPYTVKDLIQPEVTEFSLDLGEKITIPITVTVPINAEPRGYYGALIVSNEPEVLGDATNPINTEGQARLISRIGSLFFLRVNGEGKEGGSIDSFKVAGPSKVFYENRPGSFEIGFKNIGNVHLVPHGKITINNVFGKSIGEIPVDAYFSLPDSVRYREVFWEKGIGLGRYTANLSLFPGYGNENQNASVSFWIIPWKILAATFAGLIIIISFIYYILTRFEFKRK